MEELNLQNTFVIGYAIEITINNRRVICVKNINYKGNYMGDIEFTTDIRKAFLYYSEEEAVKMLKFANLDVDGFEVKEYHLPITDFI
ncbi:TPA: hypothetical protein DIC62_00625 [Candidatus Nomurabacteria bacterium]|nr:hypothetical protein [Candidatus Nomurabacteria bacterium]